MNEPSPQEIIKVLKHLTGMWKHDTEIKYLLERYKEVSQKDDEVEE